METDEQQIRQLVATWHEATAVGDIAAVLALMDDDVVFLAPGRPPMRGRSAFEQGLRSLLQRHSIASMGEILEIRVSGDWAYCWCELSVTVAPLGEGVPSLRTGHALTVLRKRTDGWVVVRDANMLAAGESAVA